MKIFSQKTQEKALRRNSFLEVLDLSAGSWSHKDDKGDTDKFIRSLRESKR